MSHAFRILEFFEDVVRRGLCDDCLSAVLHIEPRQTIHIVCRKLVEEGRVERVRNRCGQCDEVKLINSFVTAKSLLVKTSVNDAILSLTRPTVPAEVDLSIGIAEREFDLMSSDT